MDDQPDSPEAIAPVKFVARAQMIAEALKDAGVPFDALTARILKAMGQEIEVRK